MIRHIVILTFRSDVGEAEKKSLLGDLAKLLASFDFISSWTLQPNISDHDKTYEYIVAIDFHSTEDLERYFHSEEHLAFAKNMIRPKLSQRAVVSYVVRNGYDES